MKFTVVDSPRSLPPGPGLAFAVRSDFGERRIGLRVAHREQKLRRDHPCCAGFLDETGAISRDRFFGVGLLKCNEPSQVLRRIQKIRDQTHWYKEIKFSALTSGSLDLYMRFTDACLVPHGYC